LPLERDQARGELAAEQFSIEELECVVELGM
jgi:hypothetical protein